MVTTNLSSKQVFTPALGKRMLTGGIIAAAMVIPFVVSAGKGNPEWGAYWRIKPLLLTPALGAVVGLCFDATQQLQNIKGWVGKTFSVLSIIGFAIGLWMALILGLAGTMWN